ncbi:MAG TPA: PIN domain-containing protein [Gammaproteobacteria bacterium]|nr:PIN domain-containing protein [Gammaproteobacteria bacterium]
MSYMNDTVFTFDTNILIYAFDQQAQTRHKKAVYMIQKALTLNCILTLQALSEFYYACTRKGLMPIQDALAQVKDWQTIFPIVLAKPHTLTRAILSVERYQLGFWDAMLLETARGAGVSILFSEDFQDQQIIDGIQIMNPFIHEDFFK